MVSLIMAGMAIVGIVYNIIQTHVLTKNEIKHLKEDVLRVEAKLDNFIFKFVEK